MSRSRPSKTVKRKSITSETGLKSLLESLGVGVYQTTPHGDLLDLNMALVRIFGYESREELKRLNVEDLYSVEGSRKERLEGMGRDTSDMSEIQLRRKDGSRVWVRDYTRAIMDEEGRITHYDGILLDITRERENEAELKKVLRELEKANRQKQEMIKKLETISLMDDLTGLYNRRGFYLVTEETMNQAERTQMKLHLLFLDLDDLKKINDRFGHKSGDRALAYLADILKKTFRKSDIKGRIGGDEFTVLYVATPPSGVQTAIERMRAALAEFNASGKEPFQLSVSVGLSGYDPEIPCSLDELINVADRNMYQQKRGAKANR